MALKEVVELQKLIELKKNMLIRRIGLPSTTFSLLILSEKPEQTMRAEFTLRKQPKTQKIQLNVSLFGTTEKPTLACVHFLTSLCAQDSWWHRNKSLCMIASAAALLVTQEATQHSPSYTRAIVKRLSPTQEHSRQDKYQSLAKSFFPQEPLKKINNNGFYKQLGNSTIVLTITGIMEFPTETDVKDETIKDLVYLVPFSKINHSEIQKNYAQLQKDGWKIYFFDDLGEKDAGLSVCTLFRKLNLHGLKYYIAMKGQFKINDQIQETITDGMDHKTKRSAQTSIFNTLKKIEAVF